MQYAHGFARFCNTKYNNDVEDIDNPFIHLTNVAIQKKDVRACPPSPLLSVPLRSLIPWLSLSLSVCVCVSICLSVCLLHTTGSLQHFTWRKVACAELASVLGVHLRPGDDQQV